MTDEEYRSAAMNVVWLAGCAVRGETPDRERVAKMDLAALYQTAERHLLPSVTAMALERAGVKDEAFTQAKGKAIRKLAVFDLERAAVLNALEEAGIWYLPLKGCVLKDLYPKFGMRQMSDNDILFDASRRKEIRPIMESLGFFLDERGGDHDEQYYKPPVCNFELHYTLFSKVHGETTSGYFEDYTRRLRKDAGNNFGYHLSDEDFYIYMLAHEYKHYSRSGTGLRSLLDTYVYLKKKRDVMDWPYITQELDKLGLTGFEEQNRSLALKLFEGEPLSEREQSMLDYVIFSGNFGTAKNRLRNTVASYGGGWGKVRYLLNRFFTPVSRGNPYYDTYAAMYPLFYRHKLLLPLLPFYRLMKHLPKVKGELRMLSDM